MDGFTQGCPLSGILAAIVLHDVLMELVQEQHERAAQHFQDGIYIDDDDGEGGKAYPFFFLDDGLMALPHEDSHWFFARFLALITPLGGSMDKRKNDILTGSAGLSVLSHLSPERSETLKWALTQFTTGENMVGTRVLGIPLGSKEYMRAYVADKAKLFVENTVAVTTSLQNRQTVAQLYSNCLQQQIPYHMTADIMANYEPTKYKGPFSWSSDTAIDVDNTTRRVITSIADLDAIPEYSFDKATLPESLNDQDLYSPS